MFFFVALAAFAACILMNILEMVYEHDLPRDTIRFTFWCGIIVGLAASS